MLEEQIISESGRLLDKINENGSQNFRSLIELFYDEVFYQEYLKAESEYSNFKLLLNLSTEDYFSDKVFQNQSAFLTMYDFVLNHSILKNDYRAELIKQSVEIRFNFMVRPVKTISTFIFSDSFTISINELKLKLSYFPKKHTIVNIFNDILEEIENNGIESEIVSKPQLCKLFYNKFKSIVSSTDNSFILNLIDPIFEFLNHFKCNNLVLVSSMIFFDDLQMYAIVEKLNQLEDNPEEYDLDKFTEIIDSMDKNIDESSNDDTDILTEVDLGNSDFETDFDIELTEIIEENDDFEDDLISDLPEMDEIIENSSDIHTENDYKSRLKDIVKSVEKHLV